MNLNYYYCFKYQCDAHENAKWDGWSLFLIHFSQTIIIMIILIHVFSQSESHKNWKVFLVLFQNVAIYQIFACKNNDHWTKFAKLTKLYQNNVIFSKLQVFKIKNHVKILLLINEALKFDLCPDGLRVPDFKMGRRVCFRLWAKYEKETHFKSQLLKKPADYMWWSAGLLTRDY